MDVRADTVFLKCSDLTDTSIKLFPHYVDGMGVI